MTFSLSSGQRLPATFFQRSTSLVARQLIGKILVHRLKPSLILAGRIVETEAYLGLKDPACHSYGGRKTPRTSVMYQKGGHIYVYLIYGMHFCLNFVTAKEEVPEAVLIRALEPLKGKDFFLSQWDRDCRRKGKSSQSQKKRDWKQLCRGPGRLCKAFSIDLFHNGLFIEERKNHLFVMEEKKKKTSYSLISCSRVGIRGHSAHWPLRFCLKNSPYVSTFSTASNASRF